jgi:hypothetical protein
LCQGPRLTTIPFQGTFILVFHEPLYYGTKLDHSHINPNQVRAYGIPFWDNPYDPDHGVSIDVNNSLSIPLQPVGTKLQFRTRVPTALELHTCEHISMTSPHTWNPTEIVMGTRDRSRRKYQYVMEKAFVIRWIVSSLRILGRRIRRSPVGLN